MLEEYMSESCDGLCLHSACGSVGGREGGCCVAHPMQDLATTPASGTAQYDHFSDFYSSTRWMDDFALMAIDGTGAMTDDGARAEGTEKTVLNALLTHTALTHLHTALNMVRWLGWAGYAATLCCTRAASCTPALRT